MKKMKRFLHEFSTYSNGSVVDNGWWEIVGDKLYNMLGGWHNYTPKPTDEIIECNDWLDLDWSNLIEPDSLYGWIDLDGNFYGCDYGEHKQLAKLYFKSTERQLEDCGFVKLYRDFNGTIAYYVSKYLNEKQESTLIEKGISVRDNNEQ